MPDSTPTNQSEALAQLTAENIARVLWNRVDAMRTVAKNKDQQALVLEAEAKAIRDQANDLERDIERWAEKSPLTAKFQKPTWNQ